MLSGRSAISGNAIIRSLPRHDAQSLIADCTEIELQSGVVLFEAGKPLRSVYFPLSGLVSLLTPETDGSRIEVGIVGNDGLAGISLLLGSQKSLVTGLVQGAGRALRMQAKTFRAVLETSPQLRESLNRYLYCLMAQVAQTAACNRLHTVERRLGRWLLMTQDRMQSDQLSLTQEFLGNMLAVRRVGVSAAAATLRSRGLISYSRGHITVLDRRGLERAACGCYAVVKGLC